MLTPANRKINPHQRTRTTRSFEFQTTKIDPFAKKVPLFQAVFSKSNNTLSKMPPRSPALLKNHSKTPHIWNIQAKTPNKWNTQAKSQLSIKIQQEDYTENPRPKFPAPMKIILLKTRFHPPKQSTQSQIPL